MLKINEIVWLYHMPIIFVADDSDNPNINPANISPATFYVSAKLNAAEVFVTTVSQVKGFIRYRYTKTLLSAAVKTVLRQISMQLFYLQWYKCQTVLLNLSLKG